VGGFLSRRSCCSFLRGSKQSHPPGSAKGEVVFKQSQPPGVRKRGGGVGGFLPLQSSERKGSQVQTLITDLELRPQFGRSKAKNAQTHR
jgi:hypothetical protein